MHGFGSKYVTQVHHRDSTCTLVEDSPQINTCSKYASCHPMLDIVCEGVDNCSHGRAPAFLAVRLRCGN